MRLAHITFALQFPLLLALAGCGGSSGDSGTVSGPTSSGNLSGAYAGTETFTSGASGTFSFNLTVVQNGDNVTGTYSNGTGDRGTVGGTLSGTTFFGNARSLVLGITCTVNGEIFDGGARFTATSVCPNGTGGVINARRV